MYKSVIEWLFAIKDAPLIRRQGVQIAAAEFQKLLKEIEQLQEKRSND